MLTLNIVRARLYDPQKVSTSHIAFNTGDGWSSCYCTHSTRANADAERYYTVGPYCSAQHQSFSTSSVSPERGTQSFTRLGVRYRDRSSCAGLALQLSPSMARERWRRELK